MADKTHKHHEAQQQADAQPQAQPTAETQAKADAHAADAASSAAAGATAHPALEATRKATEVMQAAFQQVDAALRPLLDTEALRPLADAVAKAREQGEAAAKAMAEALQQPTGFVAPTAFAGGGALVEVASQALDGVEALATRVQTAQREALEQAQARGGSISAELGRLTEAQLRWQRELGALWLQESLQLSRRALAALQPQAPRG